MDREATLREIGELRTRAQILEADLARQSMPNDYVPRHYTAYEVVNGCILGVFGATTSLLFNIVGSLLAHQHPLQLIRVYLTFPMGETALSVQQNDLTLAFGCCLYIATGMLLGVPFQLILSRWFNGAPFAWRFAVTTFFAIIVWLVNFYGILSWLQPLLFGGNWIVTMIPWWVGCLTHLVFGWTILVASPLGRFSKYERATETEVA